MLKKEVLGQAFLETESLLSIQAAVVDGLGEFKGVLAEWNGIAKAGHLFTLFNVGKEVLLTVDSLSHDCKEFNYYNL